MADELILLGYEVGTGEPVYIPVKHSVHTGITRHGKSEMMKALSKLAAEAGYTVIIFDVKPQRRDYGDVGHDIPVYIEESADPRTLRRLLEGVGDKSMSYSFAELVKLHEDGFQYDDILDRIETWLGEGRHPVQEDKLIEIQYLLRELVDDLDRVEISDSLDLEPGINVMDLTDVEDSVQQLAVSTSVKEVLSNHERTIVCIDEASRFIPQSGQPPANKPLVRMIREGAAKDVWLWISDQTVTGVDKEPLKQVDVWTFGRQREKNEIKRVRDQVGKSKYSDEDVSTLEKGHFIVDLEDSTTLAYAQPVWMDDETAASIARGEISIEDTDEPELETEDMEEIETEIEEMAGRISELEAELADREETIVEQREQIDKLERLLEEDEEATPEPAPTPDAGGEIDEDAVREIVEGYIEEVEVPESIRVDREQPKIVVSRTVEPIEATADESDPLGMVAFLYATGDLPGDTWITTGRVESILESRGVDMDVDKSVLDRLCQMGMMEMKWSGNRPDYRVSMDPSEAKDRGLLEVDEQIVA